MNIMKKITAIILCMMMLLSFAVTSSAETQPVSITYEPKSYVTVTGSVDAENAGFEAALMLVKKDADLNNLRKEDVGYIAQQEIGEDGKYLFEFAFSDFTYDSNNVVNNYEVVLNVNGERMTPSITKAAVISELVSFELDFTNFGRAIAEITNTYGIKDLSYKVIIGFYDENGALIGTKMADKYTGDSETFTYGYNDIPEGTAYAKGFLWEDTIRLIPLAASQQIDVLGHTTDREVMTMSIAPGIDESERNFAWYDIPGVDGVKIQVAEKVTGTVSDFEGNSARTFAGTSGEVSADEYNGTPLNSSNPDTIFDYNGEYSWGKATVTGLEAGKEYVYRVGDKFGWCKGIYEFKTDAKPEDGFSFIVLADEHFKNNNSAYNKAIVNNTNIAFETLPGASMVLALGDNVDIPWHEQAYTSYFDREFTNRVPLATVPGPTHDMIQANNEATLFGYHFNMPNQSKTYGYIEDVCGNYWYTYGDALFIALTNNWGSDKCVSANAAFIEEAVKANPNAKWRILYTHLPFIGSDYVFESDRTEDILAKYGDFIANNNIDIVLWGHSHRYYRTYQMKNGEPVNTDVVNEVTNPEGAVYFSLNTAGSLSRPTVDRAYSAFADKNAVYGFYSDSDYHSHFSTIDIKTTDDECSLEIKTYQNTHQKGTHTITDTNLIDSYKIIKTAAEQ